MTASQLARDLRARKAGRGIWMAKCPSHADRRASLQIREGKRGVLLKCWSQGCTVRQICDALNITVESLFHDSGRKLTTADKLAMRQAEEKAARDAEQSRQLRLQALARASMWDWVAKALHKHWREIPEAVELWWEAKRLKSQCLAVADMMDGLHDHGCPRWRGAVKRTDVGPKFWDALVKIKTINRKEHTHE